MNRDREASTAATDSLLGDSTSSHKPVTPPQVLTSTIWNWLPYQVPFADQNLWQCFFPRSSIYLAGIPKNATTRILATLMHHEGRLGHDLPIDPDALHEMSYIFLLKSYSDCYSAKHRILALRDPLSRTLSAFLDRFVRNDNTTSATQVAFEISKVCQDVHSYTDVTFRQFVQYLADYPNCYLDPHWRPQTDFVRCCHYTEIILLDQSRALDAFFEDLGLSVRDYAFHNTSLIPRVAVAKAQTMTVGKLKTLLHETDTLPDSSSFMTAWARATLEERFKDDLELLSRTRLR